MTFKEKQNLYSNLFSLGNLNCTFTEKMALISLLCYLTQEFKKKKPDVTFYQVVYKFGDAVSLPEEVIHALAIICEDYSYGCKEFPTFDMNNKQIVAKIKELMSQYMPF